MLPIFTHPALPAGQNSDAAGQWRSDRLAMATSDEMQTALAYLSVIDPEAFEIAFTAVRPPEEPLEDEEPLPLCRQCGAQIGIFPEHGMSWVHYRGDGITSGGQQVYDPGHRPEVTWLLPGDDPEEL